MILLQIPLFLTDWMISLSKYGNFTCHLRSSVSFGSVCWIRSTHVTTWKKSWIGPFWCCLCNSTLESVDHLFQSCSFTRKVIALIRSSLDIPDFWRGTNYHLYVSSWIYLGNTLKYLPLFFAWQVWITRNKCLFEDLKPDIFSTILSIKKQL